MLVELRELAGHDVYADLHEMKPDEIDGAFLRVFWECVEEALGHVRPVHPGVDVVDDVVPVVKGEEILYVIDAVVGQGVVQGGPARVDKNVLGPVPKHESKGGYHEGDHQGEEGGRRIDAVEEVDGGEPHRLGEHTCRSHLIPATSLLTRARQNAAPAHTSNRTAASAGGGVWGTGAPLGPDGV